MNLPRKIIRGVTDDNVYKRIGWMYITFFALYVSAVVLSYYLLPEGILRDRHPIISRLRFSPSLCVSTLQIFGYNLIPTTLIIGANLLAQQSRVCEDRFVPIGYTAFWGLTVLFALVTGTWSFGIVTVAPPLHRRLLRLLDVFHRAGLLEFSAYILAATTSFKITLWYSDRKKVIETRRWKDVSLSRPEAILLVVALVLLLCAALVESRAIIQVAG